MAACTTSRFRPTYILPTKEDVKVGVVVFVVVAVVIMANVAPVGEDLSDADGINEVSVDKPFSFSI